MRRARSLIRTSRTSHTNCRPEKVEEWRRPRNRPATMSEPQGVKQLQVLVRDNYIDQALRVLKKKMQREGVFREMKRRKFYEKPSERTTREKAEAIRRYRKLLRKRMEREGY